jgi:quercetin dioxygenase-like cupin family protein
LSTPKAISRDRGDDAAEGILVGGQIRDLRKAKGLTIAELADRIDRSIGFVSQIERNLSELDERGHIVRRENRRRLSLSGIGVVEELLSPSLGGATELVLTRIPPRSTTGEEFVTRKAEESGLVLQGQMELWVGARHFLLAEGDSFCIQPEESHRIHNPGAIEAIVVWIITPPVY